MARGKKFPVGLWAFEPPAPAGTLKSSKIHRHRTVAGKRGRRSETLVKIVKVLKLCLELGSTLDHMWFAHGRANKRLPMKYSYNLSENKRKCANISLFAPMNSESINSFGYDTNTL